MNDYKLERQTGKIKLSAHNLIVEGLGIQELEDWELHLDKIKEPYAVAFKKDSKGMIVYSIFARKNGAFRS